jgi:hypothetical protein
MGFKWITKLLPSFRTGVQLPQALIIGGQKCGTTALAKYLGQHPRLQCAREKELDFFGSDGRYSLGFGWYAAQWPETTRRVIRFEASPQYLAYEKAVSRIRTSVPKVRLIALVRDPVERAYSAWQMYRRQLAADPQFYRHLIASRYSPEEGAAFVRRSAEELDDFSLAVRREVQCIEQGRSMECSVVELGLYGFQLQRYLRLFPAEQLLVVGAIALLKRRVETLSRVTRHLGLAEYDWTNADLSEAFVGGWTGPIPTQMRQFLEDYYRESNRLLEGLMDPLPEWAHAKRRQAA